MTELPYRRHSNFPQRRTTLLPQGTKHRVQPARETKPLGSNLVTAAAEPSVLGEPLGSAGFCGVEMEPNGRWRGETRTAEKPPRRATLPEKNASALLKRIRIHPQAQRILGNSCIAVVCLKRLRIQVAPHRSVSLPALHPVVPLVRLLSPPRSELHGEVSPLDRLLQNGSNQPPTDTSEIGEVSPQSGPAESWTEPYCPDSSPSIAQELEQDSGFYCECNPPYILFESESEWDLDVKSDPESFYLDSDPEQDIVIQLDPEPESCLLESGQDKSLELDCESKSKCDVESVHSDHGGDESPHGDHGGDQRPHGNHGGDESPHSDHGGDKSPHGDHGGDKSPHGDHSGDQRPHGNHGGDQSPHGDHGGDQSPHGDHSGIQSPHGDHGGDQSPHGDHGGDQSPQGDHGRDQSPHSDHSGDQSPHGDHGGDQSPHGDHGGDQSPHGDHGGDQSPQGDHGGDQSPHDDHGGDQSPHGDHGGDQIPHSDHGGDQNPHGDHGGDQSPQGDHGGDQSPHDDHGGDQSPHDDHGGDQSPHGDHGGDQNPHGNHGGDQSPHGDHGGDQSPQGNHGGDQSPHGDHGGDQSPHDDHGGDQSPHDDHGGDQSPHGDHGGDQSPQGNHGGDQSPHGDHGGDQSPHGDQGGDQNPHGNHGGDQSPHDDHSGDQSGRCSPTQQEPDPPGQQPETEAGIGEGKSEDFCAVCANGGDLLCCDRCPKVYHLACHLPPLTSFPQGDCWVCTLCRTDQDPVEAYDCDNMHRGGIKAPYTLSNQDQRRCEQLTLLLSCHVLSAPFHEPVSPLARNYYQIIKRPIDLSGIRRKLDKNNTLHYFTAEQFVDDVLLMFKNCATFNYPDSEVAQAGQNLEAFFFSKLEEVFPDRTFQKASQRFTRKRKENYRKKRYTFTERKYYL